MTANPWVGIALVLALLGTLMAVVHLYQQRCAPASEKARKLFHLGAGLAALTFPWLFHAVWPVLLLAGLTLPAMVALKRVRALRHGLGRVLFGVERESLGELCFPVGVCLLFVLSFGHPLLYVIPVLILTFADTMAALIGVEYGRMRYTVTEGHKSVEGSVTFFLAAFLSVQVPLLLFSNTGRPQTLLIAATIGLLVMMAEAVAWRGLDNLFIPLATYFLLTTLLAADIAGLLLHLTVAAGLTAVALGWRERTTLNDGAVMGAALGGYAIWTVGGWLWLLMPFLLFASYRPLTHATESDRSRAHDVRVVVSVAAAGLLWLTLARWLGRPALFYPFTIAFAAQLAMIGIVRHATATPAEPLVALLRRNVAASWFVLVSVYALTDGLRPVFAVHAFTGLLGVCLAAVAFYRTQPGLRGGPVAPVLWGREAACAGVGSAVGLLPLALSMTAKIAGV